MRRKDRCATAGIYRQQPPHGHHEGMPQASAAAGHENDKEVDEIQIRLHAGGQINDGGNKDNIEQEHTVPETLHDKQIARNEE